MIRKGRIAWAEKRTTNNTVHNTVYEILSVRETEKLQKEIENKIGYFGWKDILMSIPDRLKEMKE